MASGSRRCEPASADATPDSAGAPADRLLWDRFVARGDEFAFADLVRRYGPMVLGVCRRILRHAQDAEDAFQATFFVLARKARSVGRPERLGPWLYTVAYRTALKARSRASARGLAIPLTDVPTSEPTDPVGPDLREALDEELNRLPERFRAPLVLCYLEGKSTQDAATALGCPRGTVLSRLARGRDRLRRRLVRRGLVPAGAALAAVLLPGSAPAGEVPAGLLEGTLRGAAGVRNAAPAGARALADEVLRAAVRQRLLRLAATGLAAFATVAAGAMAYRVLADRASVAGLSNAAQYGDGLQGYWEVTSARVNGSNSAPGRLPVRRLFVRGDRIAFEGDGLPPEAVFRLDPAATPNAMDLTFPADRQGGTRQGIYKLNGYALTLCLPTAPDQPRPGAFASAPDSGLLLLDCRRGRY